MYCPQCDRTASLYPGVLCLNNFDMYLSKLNTLKKREFWDFVAVDKQVQVLASLANSLIPRSPTKAEWEN